jgi:eukaryotic-like serine/threonine-protein kinase
MSVESFDLWVYEWQKNVMSRLTTDPSAEAFPTWAPDGRHIAYASGAAGLRWIRSDGSTRVVVMTPSLVQEPFSFSPDGKWLAFAERNSTGDWDLWLLPLANPAADDPKPGKPKPFLQTPFNESHPMISPDGKWLAYQSDESRRDEVYVRPFPDSGRKWQISTGGGTSPVWSKTQKVLFYRGNEGVMAVDYAVRQGEFTASQPTLRAPFRNLDPFYDVSPDGKRFAITQDVAQDQRASTHVNFLLNFSDELRRRVP